MNIDEAIDFALNEDEDRKIVADKLGLTPGMISHYLKQGNSPRLNVAGRLWGHYGVVVEPFTEKAVILEWTKQQKA